MGQKSNQPPRRPRSPSATNPHVVPVVIQPDAVYRPEQLRDMLGLNKTTLEKELDAGRLRKCKVAGKVFVLGRWVLAWLRRRETTPAPKAPPAEGGGP